jgi:hypothetical protein
VRITKWHTGCRLVYIRHGAGSGGFGQSGKIRTLYHNDDKEAARDCLEKTKQARITGILRRDLHEVEQLLWPGNNA